MTTIRRLSKALSPTRPLALGVLLGALLTASALKLVGWFASQGSSHASGSAPSQTAGLSEALWRCEQALARTHARLAEGRGDGAAWLRLASLERQRADL